jgi:hypothetical protein
VEEEVWQQIGTLEFQVQICIIIFFEIFGGKRRCLKYAEILLRLIDYLALLELWYCSTELDTRTEAQRHKLQIFVTSLKQNKCRSTTEGYFFPRQIVTDDIRILFGRHFSHHFFSDFLAFFCLKCNSKTFKNSALGSFDAALMGHFAASLGRFAGPLRWAASLTRFAGPLRYSVFL